MSTINLAKVAKLKELTRSDTRGAPRRKIKKTFKSSSEDKKKLLNGIRKLGVQSINGIEEVNFFMDDESVLHFVRPQGKILCCF